jgi:3-hydroxybutyrate dehydrogenase
MNSIMAAAGLASTGPSRALDGKVAVVTGSTSGIGLGIAGALARNGAMIVLNGFGDHAEIERLCLTLNTQHDVPVLYDDADMSKPDAIRDMVERVGRSFGPVDILVNNAGIQHVAPVEEFPPEEWDAILAINLSAAFHAIRAVLPEMKRRGFGRIVNLASAHGLVASPFKSAYVAAKHGVVGLTKVVALEAAECGITCNAVCPGYVWTPLVEHQVDGEGTWHQPRRGDPQSISRGAADAQIRHRRGNRRDGCIPLRGGRRLHHRHRLAGRWRLDGVLRCRATERNPRARRAPARPRRERRSCRRSLVRWCWCCRAAVRSAPIRSASTRRCMKTGSSPTG